MCIGMREYLLSFNILMNAVTVNCRNTLNVTKHAAVIGFWMKFPIAGLIILIWARYLGAGPRAYRLITSLGADGIYFTAVRVTVDGGTNQWNKYVKNLPGNIQKSMKIPDFVIGDFDSILPEVMEHYKKKGCEIVHTPDQNYTDFTKALMELNSHIKQEKLKINHVIAIAQCSGRVDHTLGNIQTLFLAAEKGIISPNIKVYVISDDSISWLLSPGDHIISIPEDVRLYKKAWCSLVPIGEPCQSVTSSGLKWNLDNQSMSFGELVSTSNKFDGSKVVKIKCSHSLLWSMRVPGLKASS